MHFKLSKPIKIDELDPKSGKSVIDDVKIDPILTLDQSKVAEAVLRMNKKWQQKKTLKIK